MGRQSSERCSVRRPRARRTERGPDLVGMNEFISWELNANIPGATKIDLNPYLAPGYQYTEYLTFPEGLLKVRNDLVHLSDLGASISGYVIAAAIAPDWT